MHMLFLGLPLPYIFFALAAILSSCTGAHAAIERQVPGDPYTVGYSTRGLLIDNTPRILTAGSIHYPRSTPSMWDSLMKKAKLGGLNTIDTYVFWNIHEQAKGHYDFTTDRANLPLFLETARRNGLFIMLRVGPYICAEWNYGGFPQWLRHEEGVVYRSTSESFMREMKRFVAKVVEVARPYMPEMGGPIIGMQIENELGDHQWRFGRDGDRYARWCGETAGAFNLTVPWIMCHQYSPVPNVIPTQNNFYCDQELEKYHRQFPDFPDMWTEMWPGWFQRWGGPAPHRPIEDIAYAVAKWYAYGGTYVAYYMYHGGTNFGRSSGPFIQTSYDYDGFLDEYGLENWPKYLHLAELHKHLLDNAHMITGNTVPVAQRLVSGINNNNDEAMAHIYGKPGSEYLAFLVNTNPKSNIDVVFDGLPIKLGRWSVTLVHRLSNTLLPTILYNTAALSKIVQHAQSHPAGFESISEPQNVLRSQEILWRTVELPQPPAMSIEADRPLEQINLTDDASDYLWYHTTVRVPESCARIPTLVLEDAGDVAFVYFNDQFTQWRYGQHDRLANFTFDVPESVAVRAAGSHDKDMVVTIYVLSQTMGMAHNQANMEAYSRGLLGRVVFCGKDITKGKWLMEPGLEGVDLDHAAVEKSSWQPYDSQISISERGSQLRWYAIELDTQALLTNEAALATRDLDDHPRYAIDMSSMTKGQLWINGQHLGRYWIRHAPPKRSHLACQLCNYGGWFWPDRVCRQKCGEISQQYYHLPRSYLRMPQPGQVSVRNTLYVFEELTGEPEKISVARRVSLSPVYEKPVQRGRPALWTAITRVCLVAAVFGVFGTLVVAVRGWRERWEYAPIRLRD
ncbi:hypothetical protein LPJ66_007861 [Kickxella alabastrina]|uniref:Uncharacterized protein n=1 Tax=Kickxella alabastrina TaxID=61397 RepID=A0ACC1IA08_9FUNG|nr:hypothetical protein LPJ66_007861 [Kickxella alabastrina]